jgi:hypothetical protein
MKLTPKMIIAAMAVIGVLLVGVILGMVMRSPAGSGGSSASNDNVNFLGSREEADAKKWAREIANSRLYTTYIEMDDPKFPDYITINVQEKDSRRDPADPGRYTGHINWILVYRPSHHDYDRIKGLQKQGKIAVGRDFPPLRYTDTVQDNYTGQLAYIDFLQLAGEH